MDGRAAQNYGHKRKVVQIAGLEDPVITRNDDVDLFKLALAMPRADPFSENVESNKTLIRKNALDISRILFCIKSEDLEKDPELRNALIRLLN